MRLIKGRPRAIQYTEDKARRLKLGAAEVETVAEIFNTQLTGAYNWDYNAADDRIKKLYALGKKLNWNAELDLDWDLTPDWDENRPEPPEQLAANERWLKGVPWNGFPEFDAMSRERKLEYKKHSDAWAISQFMHGEQGALLVASQLCTCAPTFNAKLFAASQTFDEARHVEFFSRFLRQKMGFSYPINLGLKSLLDKILTDLRWDLKFIGMQIIIEGLALAAFQTALRESEYKLLDQGIKLVVRDEARHVSFGVEYLHEFVKTLPPREVEARAQFAYEACVVARERLLQTDVYQHFGWNVEAARRHMLSQGLNDVFLNLLFTRIVPNLKRIGLLTDTIRPKFEDMGLLAFEDFPTDGDIDWAGLETPLETARPRNTPVNA